MSVRNEINHFRAFRAPPASSRSLLFFCFCCAFFAKLFSGNYTGSYYIRLHYGV